MSITLSFTTSSTLSIKDIKAYLNDQDILTTIPLKEIHKRIKKLNGDKIDIGIYGWVDDEASIKTAFEEAIGNLIDEALESIEDDDSDVLMSKTHTEKVLAEGIATLSTEPKIELLPDPTPAPKTSYERKLKAIAPYEAEEARLTKMADDLQSQIDALMDKRLEIVKEHGKVNAEKCKVIIATH